MLVNLVTLVVVSVLMDDVLVERMFLVWLIVLAVCMLVMFVVVVML